MVLHYTSPAARAAKGGAGIALDCQLVRHAHTERPVSQRVCCLLPVNAFARHLPPRGKVTGERVSLSDEGSFTIPPLWGLLPHPHQSPLVTAVLAALRKSAACGHEIALDMAISQFTAHARHTVAVRIMRRSPPKGKPVFYSSALAYS